MDGYIGEIKMFAGTFAPMYWLFCWGQALPVNQYSSLYAIIGNQFGGDGTNFNLPDLRGRIPIGGGQGTGLTSRTPGEKGGVENVTLTTAQIPAHSHTVKCDTTSTGTSLKTSPVNSLPATVSGGGYGTDETGNPLMKADMINSAGSGQPHDNMPPWGCLNYIICTEGIWPPQN
jgi:microcystin-dependent protein